MSRQVVLLAILSSAAACAVDAPVPTTGAAAAPIVGGTVTTGDPAVVILDLGGGLCTGTVITPHVVLTAGHCIENNTDVRFESSWGAGGPVIPAIRVEAHPSADIGLVAMGQASPVPPIPANVAPLEGRIGQPVRIVGYGVTSENGNDSGVKRQGTASLDSVLSGGEMATTNDPQGTCYGDSGGPNFMTVDGVEVVAGVTSRGTDICGAGLDIAVRADSYAAWIADFVAEYDPATCDADALCATGCTTPDPDCPCAADGLCTAACADLASDVDCAGCGAGDTCRADCPVPDADCAPDDDGDGDGDGGDGDGGGAPADDTGDVQGGCAASDGGGPTLALALVALGVIVTSRRPRRRRPADARRARA